MLILHAPLTKPCEPPAALGYLAGFLAANNSPAAVYDLNIEAVHYLLDNSPPKRHTNCCSQLTWIMSMRSMLRKRLNNGAHVTDMNALY